MLTPAQPRPRECAQCKSWFTPQRMGAKVCSPRCASKFVRAQHDAEKAETKVRKQNLKTIAELIADAQIPFNRYINLRDAGKPCICCGKPMERDAYGNPKVNAGHWRSRGAAGHLRFDEANCHSQRVSCNRPGGARPGPFREGMIARVGLAEVERLEADNTPEKWQREELIEIKKTYAAKARALKKEHP